MTFSLLFSILSFLLFSYLGWNVAHTDSSRTLTDKYFYIDLPNNSGRILVIGFLYTFTYPKNSTVTALDDVLDETDADFVEIALLSVYVIWLQMILS